MSLEEAMRRRNVIALCRSTAKRMDTMAVALSGTGAADVGTLLTEAAAAINALVDGAIEVSWPSRVVFRERIASQSEMLKMGTKGAAYIVYMTSLGARQASPRKKRPKVAK